MSDQDTKHTVAANTPGIVVLQWLTYAFWGWTVVAIAYLAAVITSYTLDSTWVSDSIEPVAYGIAATLVLLPISVVFDYLYSKHEKKDKHGIESVVMVVHAVLFALVAIGSLIAIAFSFVGLLLSNGDNTGSIIAIVVSAVLAILYTKLIVRIVRPNLFVKLRLAFRIVISLVAVVALIWGAVGPVADSLATKDDRAVRDGLTTLSYAVSQYVGANNKLPETIQQVIKDDSLLSSVGSSTSAATLSRLADKGSITYKANIKPSIDSENVVLVSKATSKTYFYELCGVFTHGLKQRSWAYPIYAEKTVSSDGYSTYISDGVINVGTKCYKLSAMYYKDGA